MAQQQRELQEQARREEHRTILLRRYEAELQHARDTEARREQEREAMLAKSRALEERLARAEARRPQTKSVVHPEAPRWPVLGSDGKLAEPEWSIESTQVDAPDSKAPAPPQPRSVRPVTVGKLLPSTKASSPTAGASSQVGSTAAALANRSKKSTKKAKTAAAFSKSPYDAADAHPSPLKNVSSPLKRKLQRDNEAQGTKKGTHAQKLFVSPSPETLLAPPFCTSGVSRQPLLRAPISAPLDASAKGIASKSKKRGGSKNAQKNRKAQAQAEEEKEKAEEEGEMQGMDLDADQQGPLLTGEEAEEMEEAQRKELEARFQLPKRSAQQKVAALVRAGLEEEKQSVPVTDNAAARAIAIDEVRKQEEPKRRRKYTTDKRPGRRKKTRAVVIPIPELPEDYGGRVLTVADTRTGKQFETMMEPERIAELAAKAKAHKYDTGTPRRIKVCIATILTATETHVFFLLGYFPRTHDGTSHGL